MSNDYCDVCNQLKQINYDFEPHSLFPSCLSSWEDWHKQAEMLKRKICKTPSRRLADIMQEELKEIITTKRVTKEVGYD